MTLLRYDPGNDAAQDLALTAAGAAVEHGAVRVEASGPGASASPQSLEARLVARSVDAVEVTPDIDLQELLTLARALAHDTMPLPASPHLRLERREVVG